MGYPRLGYDETGGIAIAEYLDIFDGVSIQPAGVQGQPTMGSRKRQAVQRFHASWLQPVEGLYSLPGRVVFKTGNHKGRNYTKDDLANMVAAYHPTLNQIRPRMTVGHDPAQSYARLAFSKLGTDTTENSLGLPALGYIGEPRLNSEYVDRNGRVHEAGTEIIADLVNMTEEVANDLTNLKYLDRSAEVIRNYRDVEQPGVIWPVVLQNVALLGGEMPAVRGMDPLVERNSAEMPDVEVVLFHFSEGDEPMPPQNPPQPPAQVPDKQEASMDSVQEAIEKNSALLMQLINMLKEPDGDEQPAPAPAQPAPAKQEMTQAGMGRAEAFEGGLKKVGTATVPTQPPVMPMPNKPQPGAGGAAGVSKEGKTTVHIHAEDRIAALESELEAEKGKTLDLQRAFLRQQSQTLRNNLHQEAVIFAEEFSKPGNMIIPAALKADVIRLYENAPDTQVFSDGSGQEKSFKEQFKALIAKWPKLVQARAYSNPALNLLPDTDSGHRAEVVQFAEEQAKKIADEQGIPYAQALYEFAHDKMDGEQFISAMGINQQSQSAV